MCGFAGIFDSQQSLTPDRRLLEKMAACLAHRGPDDSGLHLEPGVGLAHRRLAIIDLARGQQPMYNEDRSVVVVYNGEIYNFVALMAELQRLGHLFLTHSDTEVIVHAWEEWGPACVQRFRGMFAFALWDRNRETLFLARDRLGIKPLYYAPLADGQLLFGSELKALQQYRKLDRQLDDAAIEEYFAFGYIPEPRSIYRSVKKLRPGHTLLMRRGERDPAPTCYWDLPFDVEESLPSLDEAAQTLIERLREAVSMRLIAEVPLGAFLSGGIDSSAVVAMMGQISDSPVNTFTAVFGELGFNEAEYAEQVAAHLACQHHESFVDSDDLSSIDAVIALFDEPFADSSALPTYRVCELASRHVKVVLSGDGGDENLAGYRRYRDHIRDISVKGLLPAWLRGGLGLAGRCYPDPGWLPNRLRGRQGLLALAQDPVESFADMNAVLKRDLRRTLYTSAFAARLQGYEATEVFRHHSRLAATDDPLSLAQYLDIKTYLPGDILTKVDRASMANSIEIRVPLLDHSLLEWLGTLPSAYKLRHGVSKLVLKKAMQPYVPEAIIARHKQGFAVPVDSWFRGALRERVRHLSDSAPLLDSGVFERRELRGLVRQHESARRNWGNQLWALMTFDAFLRREAGVEPLG